MDPTGGVLTIVKDIYNLVSTIKQAVETVRQNEKICEQIGENVGALRSIVRRLCENNMASDPDITIALNALMRTFDLALKLVQKCQQKEHYLLSLTNGASRGRQLKQVNKDILAKTNILNLATNVTNNENIEKAASKLDQILAKQDHLAEVSREVETSRRSDKSYKIIHLPYSITSRCKKFTFAELEMAKLKFAKENLIGESYFCEVHKGQLSEELVAIKRIIPQTQSEWQYIPMFQLRYHHESIVRILGYCYSTQRERASDEGTSASAKARELFIVEEYMPLGSLMDMYEAREYHSQLDWRTVFSIMRKVAQCLAYIHENRFLHLCLDASSIFFDSGMNPKISGFGYSMKLDHYDQEVTQTETDDLMMSIRVMPPEYEKKGIVSVKTDVYCFGSILLMAILSVSSSDRWEKLLLELAVLGDDIDFSQAEWSDLCDPWCHSADLRQIRRFILIGKLCVERKRVRRPTMTDVLEMLDGRMQVPTERISK